MTDAQAPNAQASAATYTDRDGFDPDFLPVRVPLPGLGEAERRFGPAAPLLDGSGTLLTYRHFSLVMSRERRLAFFTAVNIDGSLLFDYPRSRDVWHFDPRLDAKYQVADPFYSNEPGPHGFFDRGHLVRRRDPVWGTGATLKQANDDTFHWTNCSPQYYEFNQGDTLWQGLENFILSSAEVGDLKVTVFTGPVFDDADPLHREVKIPQQFWKVVAVCDAAGKLHSSAYTVSQAPFVAVIPFSVPDKETPEGLPVGPYRTFQLSLKGLETLTGLEFGDVLRSADTFAGQMPRTLSRLSEIQFMAGRVGMANVQERSLPGLGVEVDGGRVLYFGQVTPPTGPGQVQTQDFSQTSASLQDALKRAIPTLDEIAATLKEVNEPDEVWLQLGLKITADANVILARLGTEGTLNVTLKWVNTLPDGTKNRS